MHGQMEINAKVSWSLTSLFSTNMAISETKILKKVKCGIFMITY